MTERPCDRWEGFDGGALAARWGARTVHLFERVGSTNDVARRLAAAGAGSGVVVLSEEQVAGRGRAGRSWASPPGLGVWVTVIGTPAAEGGAALIPLRAGLAVAAALDEFLPPPGVGIKWPNDLWIGTRKVGGILCEATWEGAVAGPTVVGVGLNVLHRPADFPPGIRSAATSLSIEAEGELSRLHVADRVIPAVLEAARVLGVLDAEALAARDLLRGRRVAVADPMTGRGIVEGVAEGIDSDGCLRVRDERGVEHVLRSGSVRTM